MRESAVSRAASAVALWISSFGLGASAFVASGFGPCWFLPLACGVWALGFGVLPPMSCNTAIMVSVIRSVIGCLNLPCFAFSRLRWASGGAYFRFGCWRCPCLAGSGVFYVGRG